MNRKQLIKEIEALPDIHGIDQFLSDAIEEAKKKFKAEIERYSFKRNPSFKDGLDENKSYFFELNRCKDSNIKGVDQWELGKFKLKNQPDIVKAIVFEFSKKVNDYETSPGLIQKDALSSPYGGKSFEISFIKEKERIAGFVKVAEEEAQEEETREKQEENSMIRVPTNYQNLNREEIYDKIFQLMEENPEIREDIFFYFYMLQKHTPKYSKGNHVSIDIKSASSLSRET
jgi:hypothetical protein